jgi:hypothetical protein
MKFGNYLDRRRKWERSGRQHKKFQLEKHAAEEPAAEEPIAE